MATRGKGQILTNHQITALALTITKNDLSRIARDFMGFTEESVTSVQMENLDDDEAFKRKIIQIWANKNSVNQVNVR